MKNDYLPILLLLMSILAISLHSCNAQVGAKTEMPPTNSFDSKISARLGDSIINVLQGKDVIIAYRLRREGKKTVKDTSAAGFLSFAVEKKIPEISQEHADRLIEILSRDASYDTSGLMPSCGFYPDLGFDVKSGGKSVKIALSTTACSIIRIYKPGSKTVYITADVFPSVDTFYQFARMVFPRSYPVLTTPITRPTVTETPVILPQVQVSQVDTTQQVNNPTNPPVEPIDTVAHDGESRAKEAFVEHKISAGQTLKMISEMYKVPENMIKELNPSIKKDSDLKAGNMIVIVPLYHIVQEPTESFATVATKYNIPIKQLEDLNTKLKGQKFSKKLKVRIR